MYLLSYYYILTRWKARTLPIHLFTWIYGWIQFNCRGLSFFMIVEWVRASTDVITLFHLCWRVEGWNIVIELDCHPPLNWDQSQAGLCKWTLIWESVCPGHRASSAKKSWLGPPHPHLEPRVSGCSSREHVLVVVVCISASDSLHHALGNHGSTWGLCQHNDKKEVMNSALLLIVL